MDTMLYLGPNYPIPLRTAYEYTEDLEFAGEAEVKRQWDGKAVFLAPTYSELVDISIQATGWRLPADLKRGAVVTVHSRKTWSKAIHAGESSVELDRDAVPGSIRVVKTIDGNRELPQPFTVSGRVVTLTAPATGTVIVLYRPIFECLLASIKSSISHGSGDGNFALTLSETGW